MTENRASAPGAGVTSVPGIDVKINLPKDPEKDYGKLLGYASVNLGSVFAVNNIRIFDSVKGPFVSMPSSKGRDGQYHDICCPTTKEMRQALNAAVLGAYQREVERPSVRGALKEAAKAAAERPTPAPQRTADKGER